MVYILLLAFGLAVLFLLGGLAVLVFMFFFLMIGGFDT